MFINKAYGTSIVIESFVIYKNIDDVMVHKEKKPRMKFIEKVKHIIKAKKSPVLLIILTENAITISSTALPILSQLCYMVYPSIYWGLGAGFVIGLIQM